MKKETLDKLRQYIDLVVAQAQASFCAPLSFRSNSKAVIEQVWQEFIEAAEAEEIALEELPDELVTLHHAVADLMEQ